MQPAQQYMEVLRPNAGASAMHPGCSFELEASGRMVACVDAVRLHQQLVNLLGNAGQHGENGSPCTCW